MAAEVPSWEKHTKGIGSKLLQKFGFKGRLGAREDGMAKAIEVNVRPTGLGLGFGDDLAAEGKKGKKEAKVATNRKEKRAAVADKEEWKANKYQRKAFEEQSDLFMDDLLGNSAVSHSEVIIDMRGRDISMVGALSSLHNAQDSEEEEEGEEGNQSALGRELVYNLNLVEVMRRRELHNLQGREQRARQAAAALDEQAASLESAISESRQRQQRLEAFLQTSLMLQKHYEEGGDVQGGFVLGEVGRLLLLCGGDFQALQGHILLEEGVRKIWASKFSPSVATWQVCDIHSTVSSLLLSVEEAGEELENHPAHANSPAISPEQVRAYLRQRVSSLLEELVVASLTHFFTHLWRPLGEAERGGREREREREREGEAAQQLSRLTESFQLISARALRELLHSAVLPRLVETVRDLPDPLCPLLAGALLPWLPLLQSDLAPLFPEIRKKLANHVKARLAQGGKGLQADEEEVNLTHYTEVLEASALLLSPWAQVFDKISWDALLSRHFIPLLSLLLASFFKQGQRREAESTRRAAAVLLSYSSLLSAEQMACLLYAAAGPPYLQQLLSLLSAEDSGLSPESISDQYHLLPALLPPLCAKDEGVLELRLAALHMMRSRLLLPPGSFSPSAFQYALRHHVEALSREGAFYSVLTARKRRAGVQERLGKMSSKREGGVF